jgi:hypothetical protein
MPAGASLGLEASGYVPRGGTTVPAPAQALSFVESSSPAEDDLLPGLCLFVQLWLSQVRPSGAHPAAAAARAACQHPRHPPRPQSPARRVPARAHLQPLPAPPCPQVAFPLFRDTADAPPSPSLVPYFEDTRVEALLELYEQGGGDRLAAQQSFNSAFDKLQRALESVPLPAAAAPQGDARKALLALGAGAALLAGVALALGRRGGPQAAQQPLPPVHVSSAAGGSGRLVSPQTQLRAPAAEALIKRWQEAKATALGPNYDSGRLRNVLAEPLLGQTLAKVGRRGHRAGPALRAARTPLMRQPAPRRALAHPHPFAHKAAAAAAAAGAALPRAGLVHALQGGPAQGDERGRLAAGGLGLRQRGGHDRGVCHHVRGGRKAGGRVQQRVRHRVQAGEGVRRRLADQPAQGAGARALDAPPVRGRRRAFAPGRRAARLVGAGAAWGRLLVWQRVERVDSSRCAAVGVVASSLPWEARSPWLLTIIWSLSVFCPPPGWGGGIQRMQPQPGRGLLSPSSQRRLF